MLTGYFRSDANQDYAILSIHHTAANDTHISSELQEQHDLLT
jgi:hypothetical protein